VGVLLTTVHMHADRLGPLEQLVQAVDSLRIAQRQLVDDIVEEHLHAESLGQHRQLRADIAVADQAQGAAADLVRSGGGLVPQAVVHLLVLVGQMPGQRHDLGHRQFDDAAGVAVRSVEAGNTLAGGGIQIDLVGADAESAHRLQIGGLRNDPLGDLGARSDTQQADAVERVDQFGLTEGTSPVLDLVSGFGENAGGFRMDVFQQQGFHVDPF